MLDIVQEAVCLCLFAICFCLSVICLSVCLFVCQYIYFKHQTIIHISKRQKSKVRKLHEHTCVHIAAKIYATTQLSVNCLSVCLSVCPSVSVCLSVCLSICFCLSVCLSICFCLSVCPFVCLSVCPSVCLSVYQIHIFFKSKEISIKSLKTSL